MSIQGKIGSLLASLFLVLILFSAGILYTVVIPEFVALDRENTILRSLQIRNTLNDELEDLEVYSSDWGIWDDTYNYMTTRDPNFISSSAPDDTFEITDIHLMAFYDMNNDIAWGRWLDKETSSYSDLDITFVDTRTRSILSPQAVIANGSISGFVQTSRGPMLIAAYPILKSNQEGPPRGIALTGRYLDEDRMGQIAEDLDAKFETLLTDKITNAQRSAIPKAVIEDPISAETIGQFAVSTVLQLFAAFFAIALFCIVFSLHRIVILPLATLRKKINSLAKKETLSVDKISQSQSNELLLALESFDAMEEEIHQHNSALEGKVQDRTHWLQETNDQLKREIEERQRTEINLLAAKVEADLANLSKSEFLATVSHEIRTPMNGVVGMASLLLESKLDDEQLEYTHSIQNSADHLLLLINDILDISKLEAGASKLDVSSFNLSDLLVSVASDQLPKVTLKNLEFKTEFDPNLPEWVRSDPTRLRQILFNLIGNAIKFTEQGHITLNVSSLKPREGTTQWIRFSVEDTGIGINAKDQERIFDRFTQADGSSSRKHGGVGLGLSIAKSLSNQLDGEIGLESSLGKGSLFWFTIPLEVAKSAWEIIDNSGRNKANSKQIIRTVPKEEQLHILIAEDNKINQMLLTKFFSKRGHRSEVVVNGLEAVNYIKDHNPDLILMDIQMPEMDGIEATKAIRNLGGAKGKIPIIAVTANAMKGDRDTYISAGMNDYVAKPIDLKKLMEIIRHISPSLVS